MNKFQKKNIVIFILIMSGILAFLKMHPLRCARIPEHPKNKYLQQTVSFKMLFCIVFLILILIPFVYAQAPPPDKYDSSGNIIPADTSSSTPTTTPPASPTTPTAETKNPLDWIKQNAKGVEIKETKSIFGKVTGAVATFQNPDGELKLKKPDGSAYSVNGIVSEKEGKKAKVTLNLDGTVSNLQLTVKDDRKTPLELYLENTKLLVPPKASVDYSKGKKADVLLKGGKLDQMPQQIDPAKKDNLKVSYKVDKTGEATELPNGIILEKPEKGFSASIIDSVDGKDYISVGNTARLNGMNGYNHKYDDNVNGDTEIFGLRGKASKTDMSSGNIAKNNYVLIDVKNGVYEAGAGKGKTGLIINPNNENDFLTGVKENAFFAYQPRNGGIVQITKQGDNVPSKIDTYGEFIFGFGKHNYYHSGDGKILVDSIPGIPGLNFDRDAKDIASVPITMKNYDSIGKEINKGYMTVMNDNNGYAMVPVGTTEAKLSNGDVWRTTLSDRVTPGPQAISPTPSPQPISPTPSGEYQPIDPASQPNQPRAKVSDMIMSSSVRIKVQDPDGNSHGSGTIIGEDGNGNVIIATCGHLFRDSGGRGPIAIDTFSPQSPGSLQGVVAKSGIGARVIDYEIGSNNVNDPNYGKDIALISVPKSQIGNFISAKIAPQGFRVGVGQAGFSAGCSNGEACTVWNDNVASINKYQGPPNIQSSKQPIEGRSGGGLFNSQGVLIGVLNAADPADKQGLYQNIDNIRQMLQKKGITLH